MLSTKIFKILVLGFREMSWYCRDINVVKTQSMIFGTEPNLRKIYLTTSTSFPLFQVNDDKIDSTDNIKYLGFKIDPSLNWNEQITTTTSKISRGIGMLKYSKRCLPTHTIQRTYNSIVDPHLRYCCSVWGCAGDSIIKNYKTYELGLLVLSQSVLTINHRCL